MRDFNKPSQDDVKSIFRDTYLLYTKWIAVKEPDWNEIHDEVIEIEQKYPFDLCRKILVELVDVIEANYMERGNKDGN